MVDKYKIIFLIKPSEMFLDFSSLNLQDCVFLKHFWIRFY